MTSVDTAVLDLTEWLCRRFQLWTGRTNVWLAFQLTNLSIVVYFIWVSVLYWLSGDVAVRVFVATFCGGVFFVLTRTLFRTSVDVAETEAYRRVAKGIRNPRRIRDAQLRIAFLTLSMVLSYPLWLAYITLHVSFVLLTGALIILTTVVLYVLACDPLPPCVGKVAEWLRRGDPLRAATLRREPQPQTDQGEQPLPDAYAGYRRINHEDCEDGRRHGTTNEIAQPGHYGTSESARPLYEEVRSGRRAVARRRCIVADGTKAEAFRELLRCWRPPRPTSDANSAWRRTGDVERRSVGAVRRR